MGEDPAVQPGYPVAMLSLASRLASVLMAACLLPSTSLRAQIAPAPLPLPGDLCAALSLREGTAQDFALPAAPGTPFQVAVYLDGAVRTLHLVPHDVRADDFVLYQHDATGLHRLPTPASVTYQGTVTGGGDVAASLIDGQLHAMVRFADGAVWAVQPLSAINAALPHSTHAVYRAADVSMEGLSCGAATPAAPPVGGGSTGPTALKIAEVAIDADLRYYQRYGSNTTTVQNQVTTVINSLNVIYRRDVEIDHSITSIVVRTTAIYAWNGDLCNLLGQFANYWAANHGAIRRDVAHLFTGEGSFSGVIGCAYLSVICTGSAYGSSKAYSSSLSTNTGLVAHEMGHNWGAGHCDSSTPCNIMCSGLGGCSRNLTSFAPVSISAILGHKNSRTCLDDPLPPNPPVLTSLTPTASPVFGGPEITVAGAYLDAVTSVTVGGVNAAFTLVSPTALRFRVPSTSIAQQPVVAINGRGPSNALQIDVQGNHPSSLVISPLLARGYDARVELHSDRNWLGAVFLSSSSAPSALPGIVSLGIGAGFTDLAELAVVGCAANGAATLVFPLPASAPQITVYWQAVTLDPANPTLPLETSNVVQTFLL